jgi:hypothetical protein
MSIPRDHHYLPKFYLDRWTVNGQVFRYDRKTPGGRLRCKWLAPSAIAYERDLYRLPDVADLAESQRIESEFFQRIDDRAAVALQKLDQGIHGGQGDRVALAQFMVSLLHRSPSRLKAIREELAERTDGAPYEHLTGRDLEVSLKATANRLLAMLVENADAASVVGKFEIYKVDVSASTRKLLTSDRPITLSAQLVSSDAFMILPYAPDRLVILTHSPAIANAFSSQNATVLVKGINQAVVEQSIDVVIAADEKATLMVDRLLLRPQPGRQLDSIGLIRRRSPYIDLRPQVRVFSRRDKAGMRYLGN